MEITVRSVEEADYIQIVNLFKEFAAFEKPNPCDDFCFTKK
jgi:hypothetical protein